MVCLRLAREGTTRCPEDSLIMRRGTLMQRRPARRTFRSYVPSAILLILGPLAVRLVAFPARAKESRDREPNSVFADRRAKLAAQIESPIVLWGLTGREESSQTYIFEQEENLGLRRFFASRDRKSTRLNSSHANISYAGFCLKKKTSCNALKSP